MARHGENNFLSFDDSQLQEILRPTLALRRLTDDGRSYWPVPDDELTADTSGIFMEEAVESAWSMETKIKKGLCSGPKLNKKHIKKLTDADREFHPPSALNTITSELREAKANEPLRVPLKPSSKGKGPVYISLTPSSKGESKGKSKGESKGESKGKSKGKSYNDKNNGKSKGNFPSWQVPALHGAWQSPSWYWQASTWQSPFWQASAGHSHPLQTRLSAYFLIFA